MTPRIVRIILDDIPLIDHGADLRRADHPLRTGHLSNRVGQEKQLCRRAPPHKHQKLSRPVHIDSLFSASRKRNSDCRTPRITDPSFARVRVRLGEIKEVWVGQDPRRDLHRAAVMEYLKWRDHQRGLKRLIKCRYQQLGLGQIQGKAVFSRTGRAEFLDRLADPEHRILFERLYRQFDQAWTLWLETGHQVRRLGRPFRETSEFQKIPGIATVGSHVFAAIVEDPNRFEKISRLWRFCRLGVTDRTSDNKPLGYRRIDRAGHGELKNVSYTAWRTACKSTTGDNEVKRFYHASLARTGSVRHARLNTQRKIIEVMWTIWRKNRTYDPELFFPQATPTMMPRGVAG